MARSSRRLAPLPAAGSLTIERVEALPVALPLVKPMLMARERLTHGETLIVRIEGAGGVTGWGEAAAAPQMTGDTLGRGRRSQWWVERNRGGVEGSWRYRRPFGVSSSSDKD